MNAVEQIVEIYFRHVRNCFTHADVKIENGNNRQIDLLAYSLKENKSYHIESSVTHMPNWNPIIADIENRIKYKFLGYPRPNNNQSSRTDSAKMKSYEDHIRKTYESHGMDWDNIIRVWVLWCKDKFENLDWTYKFCEDNKLNPENLEILSFRDDIIPSLEGKIGTSNYEHEIMRTISLLSQYKEQTKNTKIKK